MYCANYNAIDTKASGIIQFVGILLGIIGLQSVKIQLNIFQFIALSSFLASLIFATLTWFVRDMLTVPRSTKVKDRINYLGQESGIEELLKCISEASTSVHDLIKRKLIYIKIAFSFMFLGVLMLIISYGVRMIS